MHKNVTVPVVMISGIVKIMFNMILNRPDAVFGTGGFVSSPTLIAAKLFFYLSEICIWIGEH